MVAIATGFFIESFQYTFAVAEHARFFDSSEAGIRNGGILANSQFAKIAKCASISHGQPEIPADFGMAWHQPILNISESEPELSATLIACRCVVGPQN